MSLAKCCERCVTPLDGRRRSAKTHDDRDLIEIRIRFISPHLRVCVVVMVLFLRLAI